MMNDPFGTSSSQDSIEESSICRACEATRSCELGFLHFGSLLASAELGECHRCSFLAALIRTAYISLHGEEPEKNYEVILNSTLGGVSCFLTLPLSGLEVTILSPEDAVEVYHEKGQKVVQND